MSRRGSRASSSLVDAAGSSALGGEEEEEKKKKKKKKKKTQEPPFPMRVMRVFEDAQACVISGLVPAAVFETSSGAASTPFQACGVHFVARVAPSENATHANVTLQCPDAGTQHHVYAHTKVGFRSFDGRVWEGRPLHAHFTRPFPWGRTAEGVAELEPLLRDRKVRMSALRRPFPDGPPCLCVKLEMLLRVVEGGPGGYRIYPLPKVEYPSPTEELVAALEGGRWALRRDTMQSDPETPEVVRVSIPEWGWHNAMWSEGIPTAQDTEPRVWEFEVTVTHPVEEAFGTLRVGVAPRSRFTPDTPDILDAAAAADQEGTCWVPASGRAACPPAAGSTATIVVRVDMLDKQLSWSFGSEEDDDGVEHRVFSDPTPLPEHLLVAGEVYPFVTLHYSGDEARLVRGGVVPPPDERDAAEALQRATAVFHFADPEGAGSLETGKLEALAQRTGNTQLLTAFQHLQHPPRLHDLVAYYEGSPDALQADYPLILPWRREPKPKPEQATKADEGNAQAEGKEVPEGENVDGGGGEDGEFKPKRRFDNVSFWADAEREVLPEVPKQTRQTVDGPKTLAEFLQDPALGEEAWFEAEVVEQGGSASAEEPKETKEEEPKETKEEP